MGYGLRLHKTYISIRIDINVAIFTYLSFQWHPRITCEENIKRLAADGHIESIGIPFESDLIKCCPMCGVPIEKDEGCAQMMCKRCKHVFCWYCLASLDVSIDMDMNWDGIMELGGITVWISFRFVVESLLKIKDSVRDQ